MIQQDLMNDIDPCKILIKELINIIHDDTWPLEIRDEIKSILIDIKDNIDRFIKRYE